MIADAASPGSLTTTVRRAPTPDGAMLYDASRLSNADAALFDARQWIDRAATARTPAGRGETLFIERAGVAWVLRHYRRGGFMARLSADRYLWTGEERTRPFREWRLLHELHAAGLPVPAPIAAQFRRRGLTYSGDLITERIEGAPVSALLRIAPLPLSTWDAIGRCIRRLHDAGACHADLNAHNILIDSSERVFLIDFDRGRRRAPGTWRAANLSRLHRSLKKISREMPPDRFSSREWSVLRNAYEGETSYPERTGSS